MAIFTITTPKGQVHHFEGSLIHAQKEMAKYGPGSKLKLTHPGSSGHGTNGLDY